MNDLAISDGAVESRASTVTLRIYEHFPISDKHADYVVTGPLPLGVFHACPSALVYVNGQKIPREWWGQTTVKPGAVVTCCPIVGKSGGGKGILRIVASLALVAADVATAGALTPVIGAVYAAAAGAAVALVGSLAINALIPPPNQSIPSYQSPKAKASLTGAQNTLDPFNSIDKLYGKVKAVPKMGGKPVTEIKGNDQYLRLLMIVGHSKLKISDIEVGGTPVDQYDEVTYNVIEDLTSESQLTIYTQAIDETQLTVAMNDNDSTATRRTALETKTVSLDLTAPSGLGRAQAKGGKNLIAVEYRVETRPVGGTTWTTMTTVDGTNGLSSGPAQGSVESNVSFHIQAITFDTQRFGLTFDVTQGQYDIRLTRLSTYERDDHGSYSKVSPSGSSIFSKVTWTTLRSIKSSSAPILSYSDGLTAIEMRIKATDQLNNTLPPISCIAESYLQVWNGTAWVEQTTSNPAWCYLDRLIGKGVKTPISMDRVDTSAIIDWASRCDNLGYSFNAAVRDGTRFESMRDIAAIGRASFAMNGDLYSIVEDIPQTVSRQLFTARNSWNVKGSKIFTQVPDALRVQWINPDADWQQDERIVYADGFDSTNAEVFETLDLTYGVTDPDLAYKLGRYHLAVGRLRPESFTRTVDIESIVAKRGDLVHIQQDAGLIGLSSGRVTSVDTANETITVDQSLAMDGTKTYAVRVRTHQNVQVYFRLVAHDGETNTFTFDTAYADYDPANLDLISVGDLVAFGEIDKETIPVLIKSIQAESENSATLTFVPYNDGVYTSDSGTIPSYDPTLTKPTDQSRVPPPAPVILQVRSDTSVFDTASDGSLIPRIELDYWLPSTTGKLVDHIEAAIQHETEDWRYFTFKKNQTIYFSNIIVGDTYNIRIRSVSASGNDSSWAYENSYVVLGDTPAPPTDVTVDIGTFDVSLAPVGVTGAQYEFWRSGTALADADITTNATKRGTSAHIQDTGLIPDTDYYYYIRAVDMYGDSAWYPVQAHTLNEPSAVLKNLSNTIAQTQLAGTLLEPIHLINDPSSVNGSVNQRISTAQTDNTNARASLSTTLQSDYNGQFATVNQTLSTKADDSTVNAMWSVRLQGQTKDGKNIYAGFGLGLNGATSSAIFDVSNFAIGSSTTNATYAFIVSGGKVIMDEALIGTVTFSKLVDGTGNFLVNSQGQIKATYIEVGSITIGSLSGTADWQTQVAGAGKPTDNADVTKDNAAKSISITDTRNDNQPPSWYRTNYGVQVVSEFKYATSIGLTSAQVGSQYCTLITHAQWSDSSGGPLTQAVHCDNGIFVRQSVNETTWGSWNKADQTSQNTSANTAAVGSLNVSDIESASFNGFFNGFEGSTFNNWAVASGNTITASTDSFSGAQAGLFTSTSTSPTPFTTGAASIYIPAQIALRFAGQPILIQVYAKQPSASASTEFAVAYSTEEVGNSGWHRFTPTTSYAPYSFVYDVPMPNGGGVDSISIWADTSGAGNGVIIDEVAVSLLTGSAYIDALQTANAPAQAGADVTGSNTANDVKTGVGKAVAEAGADKTSSNTSADTAHVNGTPAATVASNASTAYNRMQSWTKTGTTSINGGAIESDTAFIIQSWLKEAIIGNAQMQSASVDTLNIKGQAVIVPLSSQTLSNQVIGRNQANTWITIASVTMPTGTVKRAGTAIVFSQTSVHVENYQNNTNGGNYYYNDIYLRVLVNGVAQSWQPYLGRLNSITSNVNTFGASAKYNFLADIAASANTIELQINVEEFNTASGYLNGDNSHVFNTVFNVLGSQA